MRRCLFLLLPLFFASCQPKKPIAKTETRALHLSVLKEPESLHPGKARTLAAQNMTRMLFDGLTRYNPQDAVELSLAKGVEVSSDHTHFLFHLKDAYWTNGDRVTAHDFEYAWKKNLAPDSPSDNAFLLFGIKNARSAKKGEVPVDEIGVKALTDTCLEVYLEAPDSNFLSLLGIPAFFPVNARVEKENPQWAEKMETFVSNGPFALSKWQRENEILLKKNGSYWDKSHVQLTDVEIAFVDESTELALFEKGKLDWAGSPHSVIPIDSIEALTKKKQIQKKPFVGTCFLRVNTTNPKLASSDFRKALFLSLKRDWMLQNITYGTLDKAEALVPKTMALPLEKQYEENLEEAKALIAEVFQGSLPKITLQYGQDKRNHLLAQEMQQQWREGLGLEVELKSLEPKMHLQSVKQKDYELALGSWIADIADPSNFLEVFQKDSSSNHTGWSSVEFDMLLAESSKVSDRDLRKDLLARCETILLQDMPIIPVFHYNMLFVKNDQLHNVGLNGLGVMDIKWAYFE